jgi:hypothetical protein
MIVNIYQNSEKLSKLDNSYKEVTQKPNYSSEEGEDNEKIDPYTNLNKKNRGRKSTKQLYERYKKIKDRNREILVNQELQE